MALRCIKASFFSLILLLPYQSVAQELEFDRLYVNAGGYYTTLSDSDFILNSAAASSVSYKNGMGFSASLGYKFPAQQKFHTRLEGELLYLRNDIESGAQASNFFNNTGHYNAFAGMVNFFLDVPLNSSIVPYVGGGVGMAHVFTNLVDANVFAWQAMGGVGFPVNDKHSFYAGYRFFTTIDPSFRNNGQKAEFRYQANNIEVGYRMMFGADPTKERSAFEVRQERDFTYFSQKAEEPSLNEQLIRKRNVEERIKYQAAQDEAALTGQAHVQTTPALDKKDVMPLKYILQVVSFSKKDNAYRTKHILKDIADVTIRSKVQPQSSRVLYTVMIAMEGTKPEVQALLRKVRSMGYDDVFVVQ